MHAIISRAATDGAPGPDVIGPGRSKRSSGAEVAALADAVDAGDDGLAAAQEHLWVAGRADTARCAGEDQVTGSTSEAGTEESTDSGTLGE